MAIAVTPEERLAVCLVELAGIMEYTSAIFFGPEEERRIEDLKARIRLAFGEMVEEVISRRERDESIGAENS